MKVIIAGSRHLGQLITERAIGLAPYVITEVVSGLARGPDTYGKYWADHAGIPVKPFPAEWTDKYGQYNKAAGIIRNTKMADYADALIAIWDGQSKGTLHMINDMVSKKKPVYVYCP